MRFAYAQDGIKVEVSYDETIVNNIVARNGASRFDDWLWGAQILIRNSSNVKVYGDLVEIWSEFGNGIGIIHRDRGGGTFGHGEPTVAAFYGNTIIHLRSRGQNSIVTDTEDHPSGNGSTTS